MLHFFLYQRTKTHTTSHHLLFFQSCLYHQEPMAPDIVQYNKCNVQDIGETKCHLSDRFGEHRRAIEKATSKQHIEQPTAVFRSLHPSYPFYGQQRTCSSRTHHYTSNRDAIRKVREVFLVSKGKTLEYSRD